MLEFNNRNNVLGTKYPAVVEFAPFQNVPKARLFITKDIKSATIYSDPYYENFVNELKIQKNKMVDRSTFRLHSQLRHENCSLTLLVEYVSAKKSIYKARNRSNDKSNLKTQKCGNSMIFVKSSTKKTCQACIGLNKYS